MNFLDLANATPQDADVLLLPLPYEGTVSYGKGTGRGPSAILDASAQVELYDTELQCAPCDGIKIHTADPLMLSGAPGDVHEEIRQAAKKLATAGAFVLGLGGEHSATYPLVRGLIEGGALPRDVGILQIDAHADLRNEWDGTPLSHACVMRRLRDDLQLRTVHVGVRAIGDDEPGYIEANGVPVFFAPFSCDQIPDILNFLPQNVFITFDVDALDPSIMPATGTPVPGGLLWHETLQLLRAVYERRDVCGMDIVELAPIPGFHAPDFLTAQLVYKCISYRFSPLETRNRGKLQVRLA